MGTTAFQEELLSEQQETIRDFINTLLARTPDHIAGVDLYGTQE